MLALLIYRGYLCFISITTFKFINSFITFKESLYVTLQDKVYVNRENSLFFF